MSNFMNNDNAITVFTKYANAIKSKQPSTLDTPVTVAGQSQTTVQNALSALASDGAQKTVILSYGSSTWDDFINAYNRNALVYCRVSNSDEYPAGNPKRRLAFMAYVNSPDAPTEVEFQYYRSVSSKTGSQQGDQVFVYKLTKQTSGSGTWSFIVRPTYTIISSGDGVTCVSVGSAQSPELKLTTPSIASSFSDEAAYAVNDMVFYEGNLYTFTTAHPAGAWNANDVAQRTVGGEIADLKDSVDTVKDNISSILSLYNTKNLLNMESQSGSFTHGSMTFAVNADNSVTLNGDTDTYSTSSSNLLSFEGSFVERRHIPKGQYVFSGLGDLIVDSPEFHMMMTIEDGSSAAFPHISNDGINPTEYTFNIVSDTAYIRTLQIEFREQTSISNKIIYPMIRAAGTDDAYVPFTKTNRQLTTEINYLNQVVGPATIEQVTLTDESVSAYYAKCYKYSNGLVRVNLSGLPITVTTGTPSAMNLISGLPTPVMPAYIDFEVYLWAKVIISGGYDMAPIKLSIVSTGNKVYLRYVSGIPSTVSAYHDVQLYGDFVYWSNS